MCACVRACVRACVCAELQEQLLELDERNIEAAEKLLDFMLKEEGKPEDDNVSRWHLFEDALKSGAETIDKEKQVWVVEGGVHLQSDVCYVLL